MRMERLDRALSEGEAAGPARCRSQRLKIDDVAAFQRQGERGSVGVDDAIVGPKAGAIGLRENRER